jgi:hypothetical protein
MTDMQTPATTTAALDTKPLSPGLLPTGSLVICSDDGDGSPRVHFSDDPYVLGHGWETCEPIIPSEAAPTKTCRKCLATCELAEFARHPKSKDGLQYYCRPCIRGQGQVSWQRGSVRGRRTADKRRWKEEVDDFGEQITVERINDLLVMQQGRCMYCSTVMLYGLGIDRNTHPRGVTVERVDNDVPHTIGNCVLACQSCNTKRRASYTYEEFMEHHANIKLNLVKKCQNECGRILPITSFHKKIQRHHSACKSCRRHQTAKPY